jgi:hypothetical protein
MSLVTAALIAAATAFMQLQIMNATRDCQALTGGFRARRNHVGKGIERTNEGSPAKWRLAAN